MSSKVIPLMDRRQTLAIPALPPQAPVRGAALHDSRGRPLRDLRISVTDRCNFRCVYCMPREAFGKDHAFLPHHALLSFEEITRVARIAADHGVEKIRLTGGEPLLRKNIEVLIGMLADLRRPDGQPLDLTHAVIADNEMPAEQRDIRVAGGKHRPAIQCIVRPCETDRHRHG